MNLRAWLELSRCSNLPTVWSNVVHGLAAGLFVVLLAHEAQDPGALLQLPEGVGFYLDQGFMLLLGMSLIYTAGMVLNDVCDAKDDAVHRPGRPIPSGRVSRGAAGVVGAVMLVLGVAATAGYPCAVVWVLSAMLAACVVAYNLLHRIKLAGYLLMPICRALVLMTAASAYPRGTGTDGWYFHVALPAIVLAVYTAVIFLVAWPEHLAGKAHLKKIVPGMIVAMPLIDAVFLGWIGMWPVAGFCVGCAALTWVGQRFIPGT